MAAVRILHVVSTSDFVDHFLKDQIVHFSNLGYEVFVACSPDARLNSLSISNSFTAIPIDIYRSYTPIADLLAVRKLMREIRRHNIDMVIGHTPKGALVSMVAAKISNVKHRIYYRHGVLFQTSTGLKRKVLRLLEKLTGRCATQVVNVSRSVQSFAVRHNLNSLNKNVFIGRLGSCGALNPLNYSRKSVELKARIEFQEFYCLESMVVVGFIGRMVNDKGVVDLIDAWKLLLKNNKNIKLIFAGPYEDQDALSTDIKNYIESEPSIVHLQYFSDPKIVYSILDIFVLPSYREGLPTVILEASAMELPVVTTQVTGCSDSIINEETGLFCSHTPGSIADKIQFYIDNPAVRGVHGLRGRDFVLRNFNQNEIWCDFEDKVLKPTKIV